MGYANISLFRQLTNFKKELISDYELQGFFTISDRLVNKLISTKIFNEQLHGNINGSNTLFYTQHAPICDTTMKNVLTLDTCDATTSWTASTDATATTLTGQLVEGYGALALGKDGTTVAAASYTKTVTSRDGTGRKLKMSLYIKDIKVLKQTQSVSIKVGSASDATYGIILQREQLKDGLNELEFDLVDDMLASGSPDITALVYLSIEFTVATTASLITHGDIIMDYWRLEDIDSPDSADSKVYFVTEDANNFPVYGSAQAVSAILSREGRIAVTTAPTTTTAPLGVYADYAYVSKNMDWNFVNSASCYMAAHLISFKITGNAPNYGAIQDSFARRDLAGAPDEWLRLCFSMLINAVGEGSDGIGFRRIETQRQF